MTQRFDYRASTANYADSIREKIGWLQSLKKEMIANCREHVRQTNVAAGALDKAIEAETKALNAALNNVHGKPAEKESGEKPVEGPKDPIADALAAAETRGEQTQHAEKTNGT